VRRSGAAVLPVAVWGSERALGRGRLLPRRVPITVRVGEPFTPEPRGAGRDDRALADEMGRRVAALLPAEYRGLYS